MMGRLRIRVARPECVRAGVRACLRACVWTMKAGCRLVVVFCLLVMVGDGQASCTDNPDSPSFPVVMPNVTARIGKDVTFSCVVDGLCNYRVAWLSVNQESILAVDGHVITKNHRISVSHSDQHTWNLHLHEVRMSDAGWYMCQVNTMPIKVQTSYLDVVVNPDIVDSQSSSDEVVREGDNVTLRCVAVGMPAPTVYWKREDGQPLILADGTEGNTIFQSEISLARVTRRQAGGHLCIAYNGVPPIVMKRIQLTVQYPPSVQVPYQMVGVRRRKMAALLCRVDGVPTPSVQWRHNGKIITAPSVPTHASNRSDEVLSVSYMVPAGQLGTFKCEAKNELGSADATVVVHEIVGGDESDAKGRSQKSGSASSNRISDKSEKYHLPGSVHVADLNNIQQAASPHASASSNDATAEAAATAENAGVEFVSSGAEYGTTNLTIIRCFSLLAAVSGRRSGITAVAVAIAWMIQGFG